MDALFPKESLELRKLNDESQFFIEQMYTEIMRVLADNCAIMTADF